MKTAIYIWDGSGLNVLIPKRRGEGFLRSPMNHHFVKAICDLETEEKCDIGGLDGYLHLEYGMICEANKKTEITNRVMPKLAAHYGFQSWKEDYKKFWDHLIPETP